MPDYPTIVYGVINDVDGNPADAIIVTIENLTLGGTDTCITNALGQYIYDDLDNLPNGFEDGDSIKISCGDGLGISTTTFLATLSELYEKNLTYHVKLTYSPTYHTKVINFINKVMWGGKWKVVITPVSDDYAFHDIINYNFENGDGILSSCSIDLQNDGMGSFDVTILNDDGVYNSIFNIGDTVEIWLDSELGISGLTKRMIGVIKKVEYTRNSVSNNLLVLSGFDILDKFKRIIVNEIYQGPRTYDDIIKNENDGLLALYAPTISGSGIKTTGISIKSGESLKFAHISLYECMARLINNIGDWIFFISPTSILTMEPRGNTDPNKTIVEFDNTNFNYDDSKMANRIIVIGGTEANQQSKVMWSADASNNKNDANHAFDNSYVTGWDSGVAQATGQWYKLDMGGLLIIDTMFLNNATTYPTKYPRGYVVEASSDNITYDEITTVSQNTSPDVIVSFPKTFYRYIKITLQTEDTETWAIGELNIYSRHPIISQYEDMTSITEYGLYEGKPIKDSSLLSKGSVFARAVAEVITRKNPVVSGNLSISYYFLISPNELLNVIVPETPISQKFTVQKVSISEGMYSTWKQTISLESV